MRKPIKLRPLTPGQRMVLDIIIAEAKQGNILTLDDLHLLTGFKEKAQTYARVFSLERRELVKYDEFAKHEGEDVVLLLDPEHTQEKIAERKVVREEIFAAICSLRLATLDGAYIYIECLPEISLVKGWTIYCPERKGYLLRNGSVRRSRFPAAHVQMVWPDLEEAYCAAKALLEKEQGTC